jgi:predicted NBD/HSP70 family sugar kinase
VSPETASSAQIGTRLGSRGSNQGGMRQYNERVVLQAIRFHGALPGVQIARLTRLTAQTISIISKQLLEDGLLLRQSVVRGKVGQPSIPMRLNPDGAFSLGVHVGRRNLDVLLIDFEGQVRERSSREFASYPSPELVVGEIAQRLKEILRKLDEESYRRLVGVGIAAPLTMGGWRQLLGFPAEYSEGWRQIDLRAEVHRLTDLPVDQLKDTAAACVAELVAGRGRSVKSFLYVFVDTFIGGGVVIDSHLRAGAAGNAGAVGSLPLGLATPGLERAPSQLLSLASLVNLEKQYIGAGLPPGAIADARAMTDPWRDLTLSWILSAGNAIALAANSASCLLELDGIILDGAIARELLEALTNETRKAMDRYDWEGVMRPPLMQGSIGSDARALGGAWLPLYANFAPDRDLFLKLD